MTKMTRKEQLSLKAWWWGRKLPSTHEHLASKSLSDMTNMELGTLAALRDIYYDRKGKGIDLSWGEHIRVNELFDWYEAW